MAAGKYNITIDQGSDYALQLTVKENAVAKDITGYSVRGQIRPSITSSTLTASFVGSLVTAASGILKVELANSVTAAMSPGKYYYDVRYSTDTTDEVEFAISYGHILGSGSEGSTATGTTNPTKAIYSQLRQVLLPAQSTIFNFKININII